MTLNEALALISQHGKHTSPHPACIVVFHGDHESGFRPPTFVCPEPNGMFTHKAVLNALLAN
jgi:hypothetical protein